MSAEKRRVSNPSNKQLEKQIRDTGVGQVIVPLFPQKGETPEEIFANPQRLNEYPELKSEIKKFHKFKQEVWAQWRAHQGVILTVVGTTAAAAGIVGIGIHIKRERSKKK